MSNKNVLRQLRTQAGMSREVLAAKAGITLSLLTKYERGEVQRPSLQSAHRLARVLAQSLGKSEAVLLMEIAEGLECPPNQDPSQ